MNEAPLQKSGSFSSIAPIPIRSNPVREELPLQISSKDIKIRDGFFISFIKSFSHQSQNTKNIAVSPRELKL